VADWVSRREARFRHAIPEAPHWRHQHPAGSAASRTISLPGIGCSRALVIGAAFRQTVILELSGKAAMGSPRTAMDWAKTPERMALASGQAAAA
jgi:hypothetical protein